MDVVQLVRTPYRKQYVLLKTYTAKLILAWGAGASGSSPDIHVNSKDSYSNFKLVNTSSLKSFKKVQIL